ncbi:MAG: DMT family transporter, partial [Deltaproteobacteria bacterium]
VPGPGDRPGLIVGYACAMDQRPPASAYAAAVGMTFAFGLSFVATKTALKGFEPLVLALLRFTLAGAILWVVWRLRRVREPVTRAELGRLALLGFVSLTVYFSFENTGIARTSASEAAILIATIPIFVALIGAFLPAERPTGRQWAGILLSFAGIAALVLAAGGAGGGSLTGNLLVLAASLSAGVYAVLARRLLVSRSALFVTAWQNLFGALFMAPLALVEALVLGVRRPTVAAAGGVLFLTVVCSIVAYLLLNYAFRFLPASRVSVFINLTPIVAVASAYALLGERLTAGQVLAAVVVVAGVWLTNSGRRAAGDEPELRSPSAG